MTDRAVAALVGLVIGILTATATGWYRHRVVDELRAIRRLVERIAAGDDDG